MMKSNLLILEIDKEIARKRIAELESEIIALGPKFREAFTQTSETWHDNAPFEAVRNHQSLLDAERQNLKLILRNSLPSIPKQKKGVVGVGSKVKIINIKTNKTTTYFIAGDWTSRAGNKADGVIIISRQSPLALNLIDKKIGDEIHFINLFKIETIE